MKKSFHTYEILFFLQILSYIKKKWIKYKEQRNREMEKVRENRSIEKKKKVIRIEKERERERERD